MHTDSGTAEKTPSDNEGFAGSGQVANGACITARAEKEDLELACAATTAYFNQCRSLLDADTLLYGREE